MFISEEDLVIEIQSLSLPRLHRWIRLGWVRPERREGAAVYHDVDIARVRMLQDLERDLELDEETMPLILSLLDQIHGLRNELRALAGAVEEQPPQIRERILHACRRIAES